MKRHASIILVCVCVAVFVLGILQLFQNRLEQGDVYPAYSSLRADPLGTMAFFETLERMPGVTARRDFSARNKLPESRHTTYLHLAGEPRDWRYLPESLVTELESFLARGGRLVITCRPETTGNALFMRGFRDRLRTNSPAAKPEKVKRSQSTNEPPAMRKSTDEPPDSDDPFMKFTNLQERWGFAVDYAKLAYNTDGDAESVTVTNQTTASLPEELAWHSATIFTQLSTNWQVLYARDAGAAVIERNFGAGSVVFASDSYFISNEAMLRDREPALLAWLVGPNSLVVFDEAHLGVVEEPGVATLMRRYRLHGFMAGLALLMGLFVWKNSFSLVPAPASARGSVFVAGRDAAAGFVNLLRRSIPAGEILRVCHEQWSKSAAARSKVTPARAQQVNAIIAAELAQTGLQRNPVAAYQQAANILKPGANIAPASQSTPKANA
ncbi:MAG: hypothetical protein RLY20_3408 [Verrucomicrobiota bacterium]|jgi:hypothetical protein